jgi:AmmeMemoRadiSam system protein A
MSKLFEKPREELAHSGISQSPVAQSGVSQSGVAQSGLPHSGNSPEFSLEQRRTLLRLAHDAVHSSFGAVRPSDVHPKPQWLSELRGVFTTLYLQGDLRGCVGYALPVAPLFRAVAETACAAAFNDTRFPPVTGQEALELQISLSILSPLRPIQADEVVIGRHGLVISQGARRGLLLPQVPVENQWDRETFLEQTCRKAGLPLHAWRKTAIIEAFTAEVFSDEDVVEHQ